MSDQFRLSEDWQFIDILRTNGWRIEWESANMLLNLTQFAVPEDLVRHQAALAAEGIEVRHMGDGEIAEAASFCARHFAAYPYIENAAQYGGPEIVEVAVREGEIIGFSTFFGFTLEREMPEFGPILVDPAIRGKRLGKLLLLRSHEELKRRGFGVARLSCYSSKYRLYSSAGYEFAERFYQVMSKDL